MPLDLQNSSPLLITTQFWKISLQSSFLFIYSFVIFRTCFTVCCSDSISNITCHMNNVWLLFFWQNKISEQLDEVEKVRFSFFYTEPHWKVNMNPNTSGYNCLVLRYNNQFIKLNLVIKKISENFTSKWNKDLHACNFFFHANGTKIAGSLVKWKSHMHMVGSIVDLFLFYRPSQWKRFERSNPNIKVCNMTFINKDYSLKNMKGT